MRCFLVSNVLPSAAPLVGLSWPDMIKQGVHGGRTSED